MTRCDVNAAPSAPPGKDAEAKPGAAFPGLPGPGTVNLRDLGGLPLVGGGFSRPGFFRSAAPGLYSDEGLRNLGASVSHVVDLRSTEETQRVGRRCADAHELGRELLPGGKSWEQVDLGGGMRRALRRTTPKATVCRVVCCLVCSPQRAYRSVTDLLDFGAEGPGCVAMYRRVIEECQFDIGAVLRALATAKRQAPDKPCLFHCSLGRDRTGIVAALLLLLAGVEEDAIITDFARTDDAAAELEACPDYIRFRAFQKYINAHEEFIQPKVNPKAMRTAIELIQNSKGGIDTFVHEACGVPKEDILVLRAALRADCDVTVGSQQQMSPVPNGSTALAEPSPAPLAKKGRLNAMVATAERMLSGQLPGGSAAVSPAPSR